MKLKINEIYELIDGFNELVNKELPISLAFKIKRNASKINEELKIINEMKKEALAKYDLESNDEEVITKAQSEIDELNNQEVDIDLQKIGITELENSGINISAVVLMSLDPILEDDSEDNEEGED